MRLPTPTLTRSTWLCLLAGGALLALVGKDFVLASTFVGDDHVFRLFARLEGNPLGAFVADRHGGEYYRPLPMLLWWVIERVSGGAEGAFALVAFALHLLAAGLLGLAGRSLGLAPRAALIAALLFFASPAQREAALWYSASTDLLAVAAMLGALAAFAGEGGRRRALSLALAAIAFWSKESALVLPALLIAATWFRRRGRGLSCTVGACVRPVLPHVALAAVYLTARFAVLGGWGGTNDEVAPWWAWGVQLASGVVHAATAYAPLPEWLAWALGVPALAASAAVAWRRSPLAGFAMLLVVVPLVPLPAAGWVVGARYFYLPAAGVMLLAGMALAPAGRAAQALALACLLGLGLLSGTARAREVALYRRALAAASAAVDEGLARGHRLFLVRGAVKDLDLAVKLAARPFRRTPDHVVIADVPASFVWLPPEWGEPLAFLLARPPLPPAGAYVFAGERIVGQARREDAPDLDVVLERLPELRIVQLERRGAAYGWVDRTDDYRRALE